MILQDKLYFIGGHYIFEGGDYYELGTMVSASSFVEYMLMDW